ncbi:hypothetical protein AOLI_G00118790 [Acnodon oligacanthus]
MKQQPRRMAFEKQIEADKQIQQILDGGVASPSNSSWASPIVLDFAAIAKPLHELTKKNARFRWTPECQDAFETLKSSLTTTPVLGYPRDNGELILDTDASNFGIGAVLSQMQDGAERVLAYGG